MYQTISKIFIVPCEFAPTKTLVFFLQQTADTNSLLSSSVAAEAAGRRMSLSKKPRAMSNL